MISWNIKNPNTRGEAWYITAVAVGISLIFIGIVMKVYFLSIVILIAGGIYLLQTNENEELFVEINENGILIGNEFFSYIRFHSFSIDTGSREQKRLRLYFQDTKFIQDTTVPFDGTIITESLLREILGQYLQESPQKEISLADRCIEFLRL